MGDQRAISLYQAIEGRGVPLGLGGKRSAQIAQSLLDGRIIERFVQRRRELIDHLLLPPFGPAMLVTHDPIRTLGPLGFGR